MQHMYITLLNSLSEGASIIHPDGQVVFINDSYLKRIGESRDFIMSENLFADEHNARLSRSVFKEVVKTKTDVRKSQVYMNTDGFLFDVVCYEKPVLRDDEGEIDYVLCFTERVVPLGHIDEVGGFPEDSDPTDFIYKSVAMRELVTRIRRVASLPVSILLLGETGVGKDKLAEFIVQNSDRRNKPFITVNCAAIAENLIESELFGYEEGSFTGASKHGKKGLIEQANGGTLFLDEINSLPLNLQGKLLRVLETKKIRPVGSAREQSVDFRLISASNSDLAECVQKKMFREDLYYRINILTEVIPPLRARRDDIAPLATHFLSLFCQRYNVSARLPQQTLELMEAYAWPGNVRELRNFMERLVVVGVDSLGIATHAAQLSGGFSEVRLNPMSQSATLKQRLQSFEREIIKETLQNCHSKKEAAKQLGIDPAVLSRKIAKYGF